jgi:hypothetical protein
MEGLVGWGGEGRETGCGRQRCCIFDAAVEVTAPRLVQILLGAAAVRELRAQPYPATWAQSLLRQPVYDSQRL